MRFKNFVMPKKIECIEEACTDSYGKFVVEPFERGYGHTVGNSLRRILLSSLEGAAVTTAKIKGVLHEFSTIQGVVEDATNVLLNLKQIRFKLYGTGPEKIYLDVTKKGEVKAEDLTLNNNVEVLNPESHICTLDKNTHMEMEIEVSKGRGYLSAGKNMKDDRPVGTIPVDAIFTPVTKVNYDVENARVGQETDYDRLIMEVWTDGSIRPQDALAYSAKMLKDILSIFIHFEEEPEEEEEEEKETVRDEKEEILQSLLSQSVNIIELSVRSLNCLQKARIKTIGELVRQTPEKLLSFKNFGKKSLTEIKAKLEELGSSKGVELSLGMKIEAPTTPKG